MVQVVTQIGKSDKAPLEETHWGGRWLHLRDILGRGAVLLGEQEPVTHLSCNSNAVYDWPIGLIYKNGKYFNPNTGIWPTLAKEKWL